MELKVALLLFWRQKLLLLVLTLGGALAGYALSHRLPTIYQASLTFSVHQAPQGERPNYFTYEGYYAQQVAEKYTDTLVGLLRSAELAQQVAPQTTLPADPASARAIVRATKTTRAAPQLITLITKTPEAALSRQIASGLVQAASMQLPPALRLQLVNSEPLLLILPPQPLLNAAVGAIAGLILGMTMVVFTEYWRGNP